MLEVDLEKRLDGFRLSACFKAEAPLVALFGPSGSGKSLTLQCLAGLARPDRGRVAVDGRVLYDSQQGINLPPRERKIGYVFQNYALFPHLTVEQNIGYGIHRLAPHERRRKVDELMKLMRLNGLGGRFPGELSGGQQQRVALARALAAGPQLLLLDEPFSALDSAIRSKLHRELLQIREELGVALLLVTHNLEEAYTLSKEMVVYDAGKVLQAGSREEILRRPASRTVARFTGAKNIFTAVVTGVVEPAVSGALPVGGLPVQNLPAQSLPAQEGFLTVDEGHFSVHTPYFPYQVGDTVAFCIRPEEIVLAPGYGNELFA
ncbi:MAG: sulfate/molybdate ABC transporter ATP-binding protein, partial [Syntrophothermus sp.]